MVLLQRRGSEVARSSTPEGLSSEDFVPGKHVAIPKHFYVISMARGYNWHLANEGHRCCYTSYNAQDMPPPSHNKE